MQIEFKKVTLDDWKLLETLERSSASNMYCTYDGEEECKKYIHESTVYFIMKDNEPIGTISYETEDNGTILINSLTVLPKYRRQGIATYAMRKLIDDLGNKKYELTVHPANTPALLIYLHLGFVITEWKDNYFGDGEPRLYLQKNISFEV